MNVRDGFFMLLMVVLAYCCLASTCLLWIVAYGFKGVQRYMALAFVAYYIFSVRLCITLPVILISHFAADDSYKHQRSQYNGNTYHVGFHIQ